MLLTVMFPENVLSTSSPRKRKHGTWSSIGVCEPLTPPNAPLSLEWLVYLSPNYVKNKASWNTCDVVWARYWQIKSAQPSDFVKVIESSPAPTDIQ